eukprot:GDKK01043756.1.p1 GENE.GDKK01043756.1~~GDKK01043756.1.p1  ORF type:complete len:195 (+),score=38.23 GDKK01043756.1:1-585(+)
MSSQLTNDSMSSSNARKSKDEKKTLKTLYVATTSHLEAFRDPLQVLPSLKNEQTNQESLLSLSKSVLSKSQNNMHHTRSAVSLSLNSAALINKYSANHFKSSQSTSTLGSVLMKPLPPPQAVVPSSSLAGRLVHKAQRLKNAARDSDFVFVSSQKNKSTNKEIDVDVEIDSVIGVNGSGKNTRLYKLLNNLHNY